MSAEDVVKKLIEDAASVAATEEMINNAIPLTAGILAGLEHAAIKAGASRGACHLALMTAVILNCDKHVDGRDKTLENTISTLRQMAQIFPR